MSLPAGGALSLSLLAMNTVVGLGHAEHGRNVLIKKFAAEAFLEKSMNTGQKIETLVQKNFSIKLIKIVI